MQQDFYQQNKSTFAPLMEACDGVPLPIALVDTQLTQFWENQYLKTNFPFLCSKDNVLSLLQGYDIDALIASLHADSVENAMRRPFARELVDAGVFEIACVIGQNYEYGMTELKKC